MSILNILWKCSKQQFQEIKVLKQFCYTWSSCHLYFQRHSLSLWTHGSQCKQLLNRHAGKLNISLSDISEINKNNDEMMKISKWSMVDSGLFHMHSHKKNGLKIIIFAKLEKSTQREKLHCSFAEKHKKRSMIQSALCCSNLNTHTTVCKQEQ